MSLKKPYQLHCPVCGEVMPGKPDTAWPHDDPETGGRCAGVGRKVLWLRRKNRTITNRQLVEQVQRSRELSGGGWSVSGGLPGLGKR